MRYHATKILLELPFGDKSVTDDDMLIWVNNKNQHYQLPTDIDKYLKLEPTKTWKDMNLTSIGPIRSCSLHSSIKSLIFSNICLYLFHCFFFSFFFSYLYQKCMLHIYVYKY